MKLKEDFVRSFRVATSSESLRQLTCACCVKSVNVSNRKVRWLEEIDLELMQDRIDRVFDESCIPPELPFIEGPLTNSIIDLDSVTQDAGTNMTFYLCACCESSLLKGKLLRLVIANLNTEPLGPNLFLIARPRSPGFCRLSVVILVLNLVFAFFTTPCRRWGIDRYL